MVVIIIGGSGSGKSEYAESKAVELHSDQKLIYIATMEPYGEEGRQRIERHHKLRAGKGFHTIECYTGLKDVVIPSQSTVLLECMSNLTANEYFSESGAGENAEEAILHGVQSLKKQCANLIIVTNNVFDDGLLYDKQTTEYMQLLGKVNQRICSDADQVIEVIHGIPLKMKKGDEL